MAKLKDIAEMVGVSISTVSRVMKNDFSRSVSEETRRKIREAAEKLDYKGVRNEAKPSSYRIGCVVAAPQNKYNNPYFMVILGGIERALEEAGLRLEFTFSIEKPADLQQLQQLVREQHIDGIIIVERIDPDAYRWIKDNVRAVIGVDLPDRSVPVVGYDRMGAAQEAVEYLIRSGHKRIGYLGGSEYHDFYRLEKRYLGYEKAMREAGLSIDDDWVIDVKWDVALSYELTKKAFERNGSAPTAIFAASDTMAIAAMRAASEHGLRIPEDIAFFGVDNIEISEFTSPPLSTIHVPKMEMGIYAVKLLYSYLNGDYSLPVRMTVPHQLIIRRSSEKVAAAAEV
ncbi:LacI family transcriptional regulator [Paenibacillus pasadenensis]|uniref:LacI family DNA-binding transcriptional regulator n=1 Tax=Paenibacillus pasadenensis TaxID=217090 RepID=UPI00203FCADE|nr:LacI family DNA-binding transcriptional regulator [Paenibacillus pasadenensis]MCM3748054.1 LacI family transcriptional regulator [Paenibacillus pasadenensis]